MKFVINRLVVVCLENPACFEVMTQAIALMDSHFGEKTLFCVCIVK